MSDSKLTYPRGLGDSLTFRDLQEQTEEWRSRNFPQYTAWEQLIGVVEEVGELAHVERNHNRGIRDFDEEKFRLESEDAVGDILVYLAGYCSARGIDMQNAVEITWAQVKNRDWKKNPSTGDAA